MTKRDERLTTCELAISTAILIVTTESLKPTSTGLGFAQINYGRMFIRDRWTLFAIARELNCDVADLLPAPDADSKSRESRHRWNDLLLSAEIILGVLQTLEHAQRTAITLRACGAGWRRVAEHLPGRVLFSLSDDVDAGLEQIAERCAAQVAVLASCEVRRTKKVVHRNQQKFLLQDRSTCASNVAT